MDDSQIPPANAAHVTTGQPVLLALYRHWTALCGERRFPRRRDVDPAGMWRLIENVMMIEVAYPAVGSPADSRPVFRYRLIGTGVTFAAGYDLTGSSFDDLPDLEFRAFCQSLFERALALAEPVSAAGERTIDGERWAFDSILLPLSEDDRRIDAFLAALVYPRNWNRGRRPKPPWNWHNA
ncbi:MAG: PAS domain-containing protein [Tistlia sp.]|uniref:PAS domain-containing protein n=1 Tax=Tistlia sp. TaxID=3057121 RepID=UPI0034A2C6B0